MQSDSCCPFDPSLVAWSTLSQFFSWFLKTWEQEVLLHVHTPFFQFHHKIYWGERTSAYHCSEQRPSPQLLVLSKVPSTSLSVDMGRTLVSGGQGPHRQPSGVVRFAHTHTYTQCFHCPPASMSVLMLFLLPRKPSSPSHGLSWGKERHKNPDSQFLCPVFVTCNHRW